MRWTVRGLNPGRGKRFLSRLKNVQDGSGTHQVYYSMVDGFFPEDKAAGA